MADENLVNFLKLVKPESDFANDAIPMEPKYSLKESWAALPEFDGYQYLVPSDKYSISRKNRL